VTHSLIHCGFKSSLFSLIPSWNPFSFSSASTQF